MFFKRESGMGISFYFLGFKLNLCRNKKENFINSSLPKLSFRTFQMLASDIRKNLYKIPEDIDLVVGIPRSGMIPAYIIGLFLNKKVCSLSEFLSSTQPWSGDRVLNSSDSKKILFVDDSVYSGSSLSKVKKALSEFKEGNLEEFESVFLAIYATRGSKNKVDYYFELVEQPRLFQWNYLNHSISSKCCFDMDGVLCVDPTEDENDDGEKYRQFLLTAKPLFIPNYKIGAIVTSRLEKYRKETETWLLNHNVKYEKLIMLDMETAEERRKARCHASFKASYYKNHTDAICFIESNPKQAKEIAALSGKQVICVESDEYYPGN